MLIKIKYPNHRHGYDFLDELSVNKFDKLCCKITFTTSKHCYKLLGKIPGFFLCP